jgi:hypothetical protein
VLPTKDSDDRAVRIAGIGHTWNCSVSGKCIFAAAWKRVRVISCQRDIFTLDEIVVPPLRSTATPWHSFAAAGEGSSLRAAEAVGCPH